MKTFTAYDKVGKYEVDLRPSLTEKGSLDLRAANKIYRELALKIIAHEFSPTLEEKKIYFDFFCNISTLSAKEIADYLRVATPQISRWRRDEKADISKAAWVAICSFFADYFINGKVTNPAFSRQEVVIRA